MYYRGWLALWLLAAIVDGQDDDPCQVHNHELLDDPWRSTAISAGTVYENDLLINEGWYRSVSGAGGTIPRTAPGSGKCGTRNPVWMDDTLPTNGETKSVTMCAVGVFSPCFPTWSTVRVKNCGSFYVYDLKRTPGDYGYCFGTETKCPDGKSSETGFTPGCISFVDIPYTVTIMPGLEERIGPTLTFPSVNAVNTEIKFEHNITFNYDNETAEQYLYDINWYVNDNLLTNCSHALVAYTNLSTTRLLEECWRDTYKLNFLVRCEARLRGLNESSIGPFRSSESFKAGFTTDQNSYTVAEGSSIDVLVTLTVPLGCVYPLTLTRDQWHDHAEDNCRTEMRIQTPDQTDTVQCSSGGVSNEPVTFGDNNCGVRISPNDWATTKSLKVYGASDNSVNVGSRSSYIRLKVFDSVLYHPAWESASKPDILVVVQDADSIVLNNQCYSNNDPHMRTFDGRRWENQRLGEYVLYHNPQKLYWVHAMYQTCWLNHIGPTCNCGVAVRNNDAVFVANFCDAEIGWFTSGTQSNRYVEQSFCDDTNMIINKNGNTYTITLPTGTQISFSHYFSSWNDRVYINGISIKPSLADWKTSSGLCGYLDGNQNNDFRTKNGGTANNEETFALDWKITQNSESLFGDINLPDASINLPRYCKCRSNSTSYSDFNNTIECSIKTETALCSYTDTGSFFKTCDEPSRRKRSTSHHRYRRSLSKQDSPSKFEIVYTTDADDAPVPPTWRNGWNETLADEACKTFVQNQNFLKKCEEVLEATANDNDEGVQSCVSDIKLMGNTEFMQSTADNLARGCRMTALKLENLTQTTAADGTAGQTVLDVMLDLDCSNNCSGNGICQQGKCQCFGDYDGSDCSDKRTLPPVVSPRTNPGLCKRDVYACDTFHISGSNFARDNMTCRASHFAITGSGYNLTSANDTFPAKSIGGGFGCTCTLSDALRRRKRSTDQDDYQYRIKRSTDEEPVVAEGFFLSVSNDGVAFSADIVVIIFDSWCQNCNTTTISCVEFTSCITTTPLPTTTTTLPSTNATTSTDTTTESTTTTTDPTTTTTEPTKTTTEPTTTTTEPTNHTHN
ncbi:von Willebrand factor D and EGF domain-containing protein-like [Mizuhopecten yessoensis]|uniref:von Willebrand factor D and EGF domain-containing protein-like n=1 Tax=Mizuhopecten yessoensis TaxID=6573 RepID=UPI000B45C0F2|nr:von Willebrand factor D and EGF domain-containing protein-like [Mizuhopecten yessoensis]